MTTINQLLEQAQAAHDAADWSLLIEYLQKLILEDSQHPEIIKNQEYLLELALSVLEMADFQQRWDIAKVFTYLEDIAIPPLIEILEDENVDEEARWYAARILGEFQHPDVIEPLVELLKTDEDEELKAIAATALGQMGTLAITGLAELLNNEDTKLLAVRSLACIRHTETIAPLLMVVQDSQPAVRVAAIEALSSFRDERVPPLLLNALDDIAATVRRTAVLGLGFRPDLCTELDLVTRLQARLYDFNLEVCSATAIALSRMGSEEAVQHLFQVLISPHTPITLQIEIIRALIWVETLSCLDYLRQAFYQSTSETVWQEIVTVLGRVQKPQLTAPAAEILLDILRSQHPAIRVASIKSAIALSLGQLGSIEAIETLILLLADSEQQVKLHVVAALKKLSPEVAFQKLQQLLNNSCITPDLHQGIAIALAEW
jgi:HEAT repeat protein